MQAINTRWFTDALAERNLSQRGLGRLLDCDASSVNRLVNGKRALRLDEAERLATLLGKDVADILSHAGVNLEPGGAQTRIVGYIDGNREAHIDWNAADEFVEIPACLPPSVVAVQYRTAMSPLESIDGWTVYVEPPDDRPDHALGRLSLVALDTGVVVLGFLRRGYTSGRYNVHTLNSRRLAEVDVQWATPVMLLRP